MLFVAFTVGVPTASAHDRPARPDSDHIETSAVDRCTPRGDRIAMTFDDGPHPTRTLALLDLLDELDVKATFFVLGFKAARYPGVVREIVTRGHSLQVHGWDHTPMTSMSSARLRRSLARFIDLMREIGVPRPTGLRTPYGATSPRVEEVAAELGLTVVPWDINSRDYAHLSSRWTVHHSVTFTEAGHVLLFHDTLEWVLRPALPEVVAWARGRGWEFDTLCDDGPPPERRQSPSPWAEVLAARDGA